MFHFTGPYEYHTPPSEYNQYISQDQQYYKTIQKRLSNWFKPGIKRLTNWFKPGINRQTPPAFVMPIIAVVATFAVGASILMGKCFLNLHTIYRVVRQWWIIRKPPETCRKPPRQVSGF